MCVCFELHVCATLITMKTQIIKCSPIKTFLVHFSALKMISRVHMHLAKTCSVLCLSKIAIFMRLFKYKCNPHFINASLFS